MTKYRKKPVIINAVQYTGKNFNSIRHSIDFNMIEYSYSEYSKEPYKNRLVIKTLEGDMTVNVGDYIVRGIEDEFYPVKESVFNATYERVDDANE